MESMFNVFHFQYSKCCGIFNAFCGPKKNIVQLVATHAFIGKSRLYCIGSNNGYPTIVSFHCEQIGTIDVDVTDRGGKWCMSSHIMWYKRGSSNIGNKFLSSWVYILSKCIERCKKEKVCPSSFDNAERFYKTTYSTLSEKGIQLKQEAIAQVEYGRYTARLVWGLKNGRIKVVEVGSALILSEMFSITTYLYWDNPEFNKSIVVAMLKGLVLKLVTGKKNIPVESRLLNFYRYLYSHIPKVADIVAENTRVGITKQYKKLLSA